MFDRNSCERDQRNHDDCDNCRANNLPGCWDGWCDHAARVCGLGRRARPGSRSGVEVVPARSARGLVGSRLVHGSTWTRRRIGGPRLGNSPVDAGRRAGCGARRRRRGCLFPARLLGAGLGDRGSAALGGLALCLFGFASGARFFELALALLFFAGDARSALGLGYVFGLAVCCALAQALREGGATVVRGGGCGRRSLLGCGRGGWHGNGRLVRRRCRGPGGLCALRGLGNLLRLSGRSVPRGRSRGWGRCGSSRRCRAVHRRCGTSRDRRGDWCLRSGCRSWHGRMAPGRG